MSIISDVQLTKKVFMIF